MMKRTIPFTLAAALLMPNTALAQGNTTSTPLKRGEYLVTIGGCHDCHTPLAMGPNGPEPDMKRALSGHPQDLVVKAPATVSEPWVGAFTPTLTGWSGPWGVSFAANLTPDPETGVLRDFTEEQFMQAMRTGRHQGQGRPILPPMPWQNVGQMTDEDLKAVFAYLRQIPAVKNKVPDPIPPTK
jgi:mono/diheme cytochrome c family protein